MSVEAEGTGEGCFTCEAARLVVDDRTVVWGLIFIWVFIAAQIATIIAYTHGWAGSISGVIESQKRSLENSILARNPLLLPLYIYARNSIVSILIVLTVPTIIIPFTIMSFNGVLVGSLLADVAMRGLEKASTQAGVTLHLGAGKALVWSYIALAPHGMLEIPSIAIASAAVGYALSRDPDYGGLRGALRAGVRLVSVTLVNLAVSAIVEGFVTFTLALIALALLALV